MLNPPRVTTHIYELPVLPSIFSSHAAPSNPFVAFLLPFDPLKLRLAPINVILFQIASLSCPSSARSFCFTVAQTLLPMPLLCLHQSIVQACFPSVVRPHLHTVPPLSTYADLHPKIFKILFELCRKVSSVDFSLSISLIT